MKDVDAATAYDQAYQANLKHLFDLAADNGVSEEAFADWPEVEEFIADVAMWLALNGIHGAGQ